MSRFPSKRTALVFSLSAVAVAIFLVLLFVPKSAGDANGEIIREQPEDQKAEVPITPTSARGTSAGSGKKVGDQIVGTSRTGIRS